MMKGRKEGGTGEKCPYAWKIPIKVSEFLQSNY